jgi:hypothetical protein
MAGLGLRRPLLYPTELRAHCEETLSPQPSMVRSPVRPSMAARSAPLAMTVRHRQSAGPHPTELRAHCEETLSPQPSMVRSPVRAQFYRPRLASAAVNPLFCGHNELGETE